MVDIIIKSDIIFTDIPRLLVKLVQGGVRVIIRRSLRFTDRVPTIHLIRRNNLVAAEHRIILVRLLLLSLGKKPVYIKSIYKIGTSGINSMLNKIRSLICVSERKVLDVTVFIDTNNNVCVLSASLIRTVCVPCRSTVNINRNRNRELTAFSVIRTGNSGSRRNTRYKVRGTVLRINMRRRPEVLLDINITGTTVLLTCVRRRTTDSTRINIFAEGKVNEPTDLFGCGIIRSGHSSLLFAGSQRTILLIQRLTIAICVKNILTRYSVPLIRGQTVLIPIRIRKTVNIDTSDKLLIDRLVKQTNFNILIIQTSLQLSVITVGQDLVRNVFSLKIVKYHHGPMNRTL